MLGVRIYRKHFEPPKRITEKGVDRYVREAIAVEIRVSEPFTIRALGPVLWVGDQALTIAESDGKEIYRFFAFEPETLRVDAPISLSWNSSDAARERTSYSYSQPGKD